MKKLPHISEYFTELQKTYGAGTATEHSYRPALKELLEALKRGVHAQNEPKREKAGAPDYIVTLKKQPLGYIEAKDIGIDLDKVEKSEQMERYLGQLKGRRNIILTDYLEFRWYVNGELKLSSRLGDIESKKKLSYDETGAQETRELLEGFLTQPPIPVGTALELAKCMADSAKIIRSSILGAFAHEDRGGSLHEQMEGFREVLLHDLEPKQFADMYAQTICYGLFAARVNHNESEPFNRKTAGFSIPKTNPFLGRMYEYIAGARLDERITWAVDDLAELLAHADMAAILADFGRRTLREDPVVHFYETFLAEYDPKMREARGVYYTPEPVVSYIVRSVDSILKRDFGLSDGLADKTKVPLYVTKPDKRGTAKRVKDGETHKTLILDPACGTGTFLHHVIEVIREHEFSAKRKAGWPSYVRDHLLPRLIGFELLMAPYAVAHMKLGMQLGDSGYKFDSDERLGVFLTNTLEEAFEHEKLSLFGDVIAKEAEAAREVKVEKPVMVILGNPPYSGLSANMSPKMMKIVEPYKFVDGKPLGEKKHWLQDDYVKFIRFAQKKIEDTGYGVLSLITNHGYLDNPTFRGMRQSLLETFDEIYILDLHGNIKKKERAPDGSPDKNVFDIQQGVAIGIFVRNHKRRAESVISHAELWGKREEKYEWLMVQDAADTEWRQLNPVSPFYFFVPRNTAHLSEYEKGWKATDMFIEYSSGIVTARDAFVIDFERRDLTTRIADFSDLSHSDNEIRQKYFKGKGASKYLDGDTRGWKLSDVRRKLAGSSKWKSSLAEILYPHSTFAQSLTRRIWLIGPAPKPCATCSPGIIWR